MSGNVQFGRRGTATSTARTAGRAGSTVHREHRLPLILGLEMTVTFLHLLGPVTEDLVDDPLIGPLAEAMLDATLCRKTCQPRSTCHFDPFTAWRKY